MHIVMIALIFLGTFLENATQVVVHILSLNADHNLTDYTSVILISKMVKLFCQFVGAIVLILMLNSFANETKKVLKSRE